jgi:hypothetical protein
VTGATDGPPVPDGILLQAVLDFLIVCVALAFVEEIRVAHIGQLPCDPAVNLQLAGLQLFI